MSLPVAPVTVELHTPPVGFIIGLSKLGQDELTAPDLSAPTWIDWTGTASSINITRGHSSDGLAGFDTGTLSLTFVDRGKTAVHSLFDHPLIKVGRKIRVSHTTGGRIVFTGTIQDIVFTETHDDIYASVVATDATAKLQAHTLYGMRSFMDMELFTDRLSRIASRVPVEFASLAHWPANSAVPDPFDLVHPVPSIPGVGVKTFTQAPHTGDDGITGRSIALTIETTSAGVKTLPDGTYPAWGDVLGLVPGFSYTARWVPNPENTTPVDLALIGAVQLAATERSATEPFEVSFIPETGTIGLGLIPVGEKTGTHPTDLFTMDGTLTIFFGYYAEPWLSDTLYETSAFNYITMSCNTVGAWWYVDRFDRVHVTMGEPPNPPNEFVFSHETETRPGAIPVGDLQRTYSTADLTNVLEINNHEYNPFTAEEEDRTRTYSDSPSTVLYGPRKTIVDMNHVTIPTPGYPDNWELLRTQARHIFARRAHLSVVPSGFRFRGGEHPAIVGKLEPTQIITLHTDTDTYLCRVRGVDHVITTKEWITTLDLQPLWR